MNKTITVYDLLGLIKDRQAPKKIKYNNEIYRLSDELNAYFGLNNNLALGYRRCLEQHLNDTVEIIEEDNKIEKVDFNISNFVYGSYELNIMRNNVVANTEAINKLIDKINKLQERGE